MDINFPRALSGPGRELLEKVHEPLMRVSANYDRVSGYFGAQAFVNVSKQLEAIWQNDGKVRLIISPKNQGELGLAASEMRDELNQGFNLEKYWKREVSEIIAALEHKSERIEAFKAAILQGLLEINVAIPKSTTEQSRPIFHSKFGIYRLARNSSSAFEEFLHNRRAKKAMMDFSLNDEIANDGPFVLFHGSVNESGAGWGSNIEDLSTHRSWVKGETTVAVYFHNRFEYLWNNAADDVEMLPLSPIFEESFEVKPGDDSRQNTFVLSDFLDLLSKTPPGTGYSNKMWLLPHQARVANAALRNESVKAMFCDEVGLGKTLEALNVIEHFLIARPHTNLALSVPASLLVQWAKAINQFLQRDCFIHRRGMFEKWSNGHLVEIVRSIDYHPDGSIESSIRLFSSQWIRIQTNSVNDQVFSEVDLLVVDEAHNARCYNFEERSGSKFWDKLRYQSSRIDNILLLTATPFQTSKNDYLGLVDLLHELTSSELTEIEKVSRLVAGEIKWQPQYQTELLRMLHNRLEYSIDFISPEFHQALSEIDTITLQNTQGLLKNHKDELTLSLMYQFCLQSTFTFRHTRDMIKSDFSFPEVVTENMIVDLGEHRTLISNIEDFILHHMDGNSFVKTIFYQRMASSLHAMSRTLQNRIDKYGDGISESTEIDSEIVSEFDDEGVDIQDLSLSRLEKNEGRRINTLLNKIKTVGEEFGIDPKMNTLHELVTLHVNNGRQVLVFSRFTDTTSVIEQTLNADGNFTVARFDGSTTRYRPKGETESKEITKEELIDLMFDEIIDVVVCSDAASEGLNLQSASVLINVDVPWNPARLLQRIGRIDRLGQRSKQIFVTNLLYIDSIESRMYHRLDERQTEGIRLLGSQPELFSDAASRRLFSPPMQNVQIRQDEQQSKIRDEAMMSLLNEFSSIGPPKLLDWLSNEFKGYSVNPADRDFVMKQEDVKNLQINTPSDATTGYIIDSQNVIQSICLQREDKFLPLHLSNLVKLLSQEPIDDVQWTNKYEVTHGFWKDFGHSFRHSETDLEFVEIV